jgi:hypothetical protein
MRIVKRHWPVVAIWTLITTVVAVGPLKRGEFEGVAYVDYPGVAVLILGLGVHGGFGDWRDDAIIVIGSTVPWSLATILLIEVGRFLHRKYRRHMSPTT